MTAAHQKCAAVIYFRQSVSKAKSHKNACHMLNKHKSIIYKTAHQSTKPIVLISHAAPNTDNRISAPHMRSIF